MNSTLFLSILIIVVVALDLFIVTGRRRLRKLKQEGYAETKMGRRELWFRAFFPFAYREDWKRRLPSLRQIVSSNGWLLAAGIASIGYGQYLMETRPALGGPNPAAELWNTVYKLEIVNYENVIRALPYFAIGIILCALLGMPDSWKRSDDNHPMQRLTLGNAGWRTHFMKLTVGIVLFGFLMFQLSRHRYEPTLTALWMIAILLFTQVVWKLDDNARSGAPPEILPADLFWMTGLLALGFAVCAFALQDIPVYLIPDEGSFWETARAIALRQLNPVVFDSGVYTFPIASSMFQAWTLRIFGVNFWGWRFASVIPAVLTVIPLYLLTKSWFGRATAIAACILMIANPYFISFSRMGYNNSQALFPVTLSIYFFALAARRGSFFYLWLAGLTIGLGFYTYFAAWIGLVTLCLGVLYLWAKREVNLKRALVVLGVVGVAWAVVFAPRIAYTASGPLNEGLVYKLFETSFVNVFYGRAYYDDAALSGTMPLINVGEDHTIFYDPAIYGELMYRGFVRTMIAMFDPYIVSEHFLNSGLAGVVAPVFFAIGLAIGLRSLKQLRFALPVIWFTGGIVFLSVLNAFPPRHTHLVSIIPCLALIAGAGLTAIAEKLSETTFASRPRLKLFAQGTLTWAIALTSLYFGFQRYFIRMPIDYPPPFEDIASWLAWRTDKPVTLVYLGGTHSPHRVEYLVNSAMVPHQYKSGLVSEFSPETDLDATEPAIIFVDSPGGEEFPLQDQALEGFGKPVAYTYRDEYVTGYALTNTSLDLNPKVGIADGINSLTNTPVRYVLAVLFATLCIAFVLLVRDSTGWPQKEIVLEIGKRQSSPKDTALGDGKPEFDFHLRIRIPPRKRTGR
jgi:hypothetical protein